MKDLVCSRRGFLNFTIPAVATAATLSLTSSLILEDDIDRFNRLAKTGRVVDEVFILNRDFIIDGYKELHILRCRFICNGNISCWFKNVEGLFVKDCHIQNMSGPLLMYS